MAARIRGEGAPKLSTRSSRALLSAAVLASTALVVLAAAPAGYGSARHASGSTPKAAAVGTGAPAVARATTAVRAPATTAVRAPAPIVTTLSPARVGVPYWARIPAETTKPVIWKIEPGSLPAGLGFDAREGAVYGLPRSAGSWHVTLTGSVGGTTHILVARLAVVPETGEPASRPAVATATTGAISGAVSSSSGAIKHACVEAMNAAGTTVDTTTTASGSYAISGLSPGLWEVEFSGCGLNFVSQWWPAQPSQVTSGAVTVAAAKVRTGISAVLAVGGEISGQVTAAATSQGAGGICVYAGADDDQVVPLPVASVITSPSGEYAISGLPAGHYLVDFVPCTGTTSLLDQWYKAPDGLLDATPVAVTAGQVTEGISAALAEGGGISGRLTARATGKPVAGVCAYAVSPASENDVNLDYSPVPARTDDAGNYLIAGVSPGSYLVEFAQCTALSNLNFLLPAVWPGTGDPTTTPPVVASPGKTTGGISMALQPGGSFSGTVTLAGSNLSLAGVCVLATDAQGEPIGNEALTGSSGSYVLQGLPSGRYGAYFAPCEGQNLAQSAWNNGGLFTVKAGADSPGISGGLSPGAEIQGTVVSSTGAPLSSLCVIYDEQFPGAQIGIEEGPWGFAGTFSLAGLNPGTYSVGFTGSCIGDNYAATYWDSGKFFQLSAGQVLDVALKLLPGGQITGAVTSAADGDLSGICVTAINAISFSAFPVFGGTFAGRYVLTGMSAGSYEVQFAPCIGEENLIGENYRNGAIVKVAAGKTTSGISASLQPGAILSGTVTSAAGKPLTYICVIAFIGSGGYELESFLGTWSMIAIPPGTYKVRFSTCGIGTYATQWWKDASTRAAATPITVAAGATAGGIDAVMEP